MSDKPGRSGGEDPQGGLADTDDPFELLGVSSNCTAREVKSAYVRLIKRFRPDDDAESFRRVREAFEQARAILRALDGHRDRTHDTHLGRVQDWRPEPPTGNRDASPTRVDAPGVLVAPEPAPDEAKVAPVRISLDEASRSGALPPAPPSSVEDAEAEMLDRAQAAPVNVELGADADRDSASIREPVSSENTPVAPRPSDEAFDDTDPSNDAQAFVDLDFARLDEDLELAVHGSNGFWPRRGPGESQKELVTRWADAIAKAEDLSAFSRYLTPGLVDALASRKALCWELVREQRDLDFAGHLFYSGAQSSVLAGRAGEVLAELEGATLQRDSISVAGLDVVVQRLLGLMCWDDPDGVAALLDVYTPVTSRFDAALDWADTALPLAQDWASLRPQAEPTPGFERFLRATMLDADEARDTLGTGPEELSARACAWLPALDVIADQAPGIGQFILSRADGWVPPDDRVWDELTESERKWAGAAVGEADKALEHSGLTVVFLVLLVISVAGFVELGWWGLPVFVLAAVAFMFFSLWLDKSLYRRVLRPLVIERFATRGVVPERFVEAIASLTKLSDNIGRFDTELQEDLALTVLAAAHRVRLAFGTGDARPEGGMSYQAPTLGDVCRTHPDRPRVAICCHCQREVCEQCLVRDEAVGPFCVDCDLHRLRQMRTSCVEAERNLVTIRLMNLVLVLLAAGGAVGNLEKDPFVAGVAALLAVWLLVTSLGLRRRAAWAVTAQQIAAVPMLLAFPIGTFWGIYILRKLSQEAMKAIVKPEYDEAVAATPDQKAQAYGAVLEPAMFVILALGVVAAVAMVLAVS